MIEPAHPKTTPRDEYWEANLAEHFGPLGETDAILCRANAPLIEQAFRLLRDGVGFALRGRGLGLERLVAGTRADDLESLMSVLGKQLEAATAKDESEQKVFNLEDRIACVRIIADSLPTEQRTIPGLLAAIRNLFRNADNVVTLSSIHQAKGLEWDRVFVLRDGLRRVSGRTGRPLSKRQSREEDNIQYVACTRAQRCLVLLKQPPRRGE